jgi:hypothetical protein
MGGQKLNPFYLQTSSISCTPFTVKEFGCRKRNRLQPNIMLVIRERKAFNTVTQKKPPKKRSEDYYSSLSRVDSETHLIEDTWLHQWSDTPPAAFGRHKTIFRQYTPEDVISSGWIV